MRLLAALISFGLAFAALDIDRAWAARKKTLPSVSYDGEQPATIRYRGLRVVIDGVPDPDLRRPPDPETDHLFPRVRGYYRNRVVFSFVMDSAWKAEADAHFMRLDAKTRLPQVVVTAFSGGAHCCTHTKIATADRSGRWHVVDAAGLDGDLGYRYWDFNGDGADELVTIDHSFLNAYDCYACSFSPTMILKLEGRKLRNVTTGANYRRFLRDELKRMEGDAEWGSNGFLGGWVAQKSLVGEIDDAWEKMLASYDHGSDWDMDCDFAKNPDACRAAKPALSFPEALWIHLACNGYPTPNPERFPGIKRTDKDSCKPKFPYLGLILTVPRARP